MKLNHFDLLSFEPIPLRDIGGVLSPTLSSISKIGYHTYQSFLHVVSLTPASFFDLIQEPDVYNGLSEQEQFELNIFDLIIGNEIIRETVRQSLDFFMSETVLYDPTYQYFVTYDRECNAEEIEPKGYIYKEIFSEICNIILERNGIKQKTEDLSKIKNKKALETMKQLLKGRAEKEKRTTVDNNLDLSNIISKVANNHPSLNIINIWDITIYQLWDCFLEMRHSKINELNTTHVAVWGDEKKTFSVDDWFKKL